MLFPVFSGLSKIGAKNLYIKNDKGLNPAPQEGIVSNHIKSGDMIMFDLEYEEIWIDVEMNLSCICNDKKYKFMFSLKVNLNEKILNFEQNLISIAVESWKTLSREDNKANIFYLLKKFDMEGSRKLDLVNELDNTSSKISYKSVFLKDKYTFESKVKCKAEFININQNILKMLKEKKRNSKESPFENSYNSENQISDYLKNLSIINQ